ncbi:MAG: flagellar hook-length control protein FliK [Thermodesulfobacteriota bacterium]
MQRTTCSTAGERDASARPRPQESDPEATSRVAAPARAALAPPPDAAGAPMRGDAVAVRAAAASWLDAVVEAAESGRPTDGGIRFVLEPDGLGRIEVHLSFGRHGLRAALLADNEHARALLLAQQPALAAALERSELRLATLSVHLGLASDADGRRAPSDEASEDARQALARRAGTARADAGAAGDVSRASRVDGLVSVHA